jgi:hypothetical protein
MRVLQEKSKVRWFVSEEGIEIDPSKTDKVTNWPRPQTPEDVRRLLGFVGYYRRCIKNFSLVSRPLTDLMPTPNKKHQKRKFKTKKTWTWENEQNQTFETLKERFVTSPILGYANYSLLCQLHTDASGDALGAVLYQEQEGMKRVISYASRGLNKAEKNYPPHKREFLALKWSICDKCKDYLYGQRFTVLTDNNPVTYVLTTTTGHRWLAALSTFNFDIKYRPGKNSTDADALSHLPAVHDSEGCTITSESVQAICDSMVPKSYVEILAVSPEIVQEDLAATYVGDLVDWTRVQALDSNIRQCIEYL